MSQGVRRRTGKDERDERGSAIHLRGDCVQLDVGRKSIASEQVSHCECTHEHLLSVSDTYKMQNYTLQK